MILALAEKHRGRQPTRRRCHTRGTAGIQGQTTARQRPRAASPAMQHNAQFRTPQFKDAKRPAAEHSGGYVRGARRGLTAQRFKTTDCDVPMRVRVDSYGFRGA
jgi:hypothetical protein